MPRFDPLPRRNENERFLLPRSVHKARGGPAVILKKKAHRLRQRETLFLARPQMDKRSRLVEAAGRPSGRVKQLQVDRVDRADEVIEQLQATAELMR